MDKNICQYKVIRRKVKYPRLEFKTGNLSVIAPENFEVSYLIDKHKNWILKKLNEIENALSFVDDKKLISRNEVEFEKIVKESLQEAETIFNKKPNNVYIRFMKTKWGSCSKKKNMIFNSLLRYLPKNLIQYVVFHEFCHLIVPNHSKQFWFLISKKYKNPEKLENQLLGYWFLIWRSKIINSDLSKNSSC